MCTMSKIKIKEYEKTWFTIAIFNDLKKAFDTVDNDVYLALKTCDIIYISNRSKFFSLRNIKPTKKYSLKCASGVGLRTNYFNL